jgi:hypothetical protein
MLGVPPSRSQPSDMVTLDLTHDEGRSPFGVIGAFGNEGLVVYMLKKARRRQSLRDSGRDEFNLSPSVRVVMLTRCCPTMENTTWKMTS